MRGNRSVSERVVGARKSAVRNLRSGDEARQFEVLVDQLSEAMAHARAEEVDGQIATWLGKICAGLDLDRSAIYERHAHERKIRYYKTWTRAGSPPFPASDDSVWDTEQLDAWLLAGKRLVYSRPSEIPAEFPDVRRFVGQYGPISSAILPMWAGGRVIGAASFGRFRSPRKWSPQLLQRLEFALRVFGSAIERKQAEAASRLAQEELALTQRRSIMAELIGSLAHELNQPLGAIMSNLGGLARLLSRVNTDRALALQAINNAMEDTKRASEIMRRVRSMFKGNQTQKIELDLGDLVNDVVRLVTREAVERDVAIHLDVQRLLPKVTGDHILLQQCILNLLMNALDACDGKSDHKRITIGVARENSDAIALTVSDNGPGIDQGVARRLFEPFVTTKANGMGLGLLVTRSIVEQHGGKISCESNPDGGATFSFTLPAANRKSHGSQSSRGRVKGGSR